MKSYSTAFLRNIGIVGHGDTGKTQLVSSLLFTAGMTQRLGKVTDGTTVTDWDEEEIARKISVQTGIAYAEWAAPGQAEKAKITFLDTPGYSTFVNETRTTLIAADAAILVVDALAGVQVVTEKVWDFCAEYEQPRGFLVREVGIAFFRLSLLAHHVDRVAGLELGLALVIHDFGDRHHAFGLRADIHDHVGRGQLDHGAMDHVVFARRFRGFGGEVLQRSGEVVAVGCPPSFGGGSLQIDRVRLRRGFGL